jgi:hypothetical protein
MSDFVKVEIEGDVVKELLKLTKKEIAEKFCIVSLELSITKKDKESLQTKLDKAESYVEQGRAMVSAVMDRWYEYDA